MITQSGLLPLKAWASNSNVFAEVGGHLPNSNFLKGAKWSPEGACLLTASDDNRLTVIDLPEEIMSRASLGSSAEQDALAKAHDTCTPALQMREAETIYDYCWFPAMQTADPTSCVFASTSRGQPVHLWDACTGDLRCTYRAYDAVDEITAATSLAFSRDGSRLYGGFDRCIRIWDTSNPGRDYQQIMTHKKKSDGLPGVVSCIAFNPCFTGMMTLGSYSGEVGLYDSHSCQLETLLQGQKGGITQVKFSPDGNFLFTGARVNTEIWCWDVRYQSGIVYKLERDTSNTNQRICFDIEPCGRHLASGSESGNVQIFDLSLGKMVSAFSASQDTVNGFEFHPVLPLAASASGQRRYNDVCNSDFEGDSTDSEENQFNANMEKFAQRLDNTLFVWRFKHEWMAISQPDSNLGNEFSKNQASEIQLTNQQHTGESFPSCERQTDEDEKREGHEDEFAAHDSAQIPANFDSSVSAESVPTQSNVGSFCMGKKPSGMSRDSQSPRSPRQVSSGFAELPKIQPFGAI